MYCAHCGQALPEQANFCLNCGTPVQLPAPADAPQPQPVAPAAVEAVPAAQLLPPSPAPVVPPMPAPQATWQVVTRLVPGPNVVDFPGVSGVYAILDPLAQEPPAQQLIGADPQMVAALHAKCYAAVTWLAQQYGGTSRVRQATSLLKRAAEQIGGAVGTGGGRAGGAPVAAQLNPHTWLVTLEVDEREAWLYNRLAEQDDLRRDLTTRLQRTCESCHAQRIVNPDYQALQRRSQILKGITALSPNVLLTLVRLGSMGMSGPDFVCPRCQGLKYNERTIVLCPGCGLPTPDPILTKCRRCGHDFGGPAPAATSTPQGAQAAAPAGRPAGRRRLLNGRCRHCGTGFRVPAEVLAKSGAVRTKCKRCGADMTIKAPSPARPRLLRGKCPDCGRPFGVPMDRVPPEGVKAKCTHCGRELRLRPPAPRPGAQAEGSPPQAAPPAAEGETSHDAT